MTGSAANDVRMLETPDRRSLAFGPAFGSPIIRVFPYQNKWTPTDEWAFVGEPPLWRPGTSETPVRVSVTFTWHKGEAERIAASWAHYYRDVKVGGPAYDDPGGEFTPGMFLKEGCTITSRGCPKKCGWCVVPTREGAVRELQIQPGWIVQEWVKPVMKGYKMMCCDCGLVHRLDFSVMKWGRGHKVLFRAFRNVRATAAAQRAPAARMNEKGQP